MELTIKYRNAKEVATDVRLLPQGTVIFEDISIEHFEGTVTKVIPKVPSKNQVNCLYQQCLLLTNQYNIMMIH